MNARFHQAAATRRDADASAAPAVPMDRAHLDPPWTHLGALLSDAADRHGDREFLRDEDGNSLSFVEFDRLVWRLVAALSSSGISPGDRVALMLANTVAWPAVWFSIARLGAVAVPANHRYRERDLRHVLRDSDVVAIVADEISSPTAVAAAAQCLSRPMILMVTDLLRASNFPDDGQAPAPAEGPSTAAAPETGDVANLQYTSGTTGLPKACILTHGFWILTGQLAAAAGQVRPTDVVMTSQPYSYIDPQWQTVMCLRAGATLVVLPRFSASGYWTSARRHEATWLYVLGAMPQLLYKQPPSQADRDHQVRLVLCSAIPPQLHADLEDRWGVPWREVYGMTETGIDLYMPIDAADSVGSGAMGVPVPTKRIRVVDDEGHEVPRGSQGQLVVQGPPMMSGYHDRPDDTAAVLAGGWLHTGDLVVQDDRGWLHLVGRLKDMIRRGGENVACVEVEHALAQHPAILSTAVCAVPDELYGEEVKVFVKLVPGTQPGEGLARELVDFARQQLASFKVPRFVEFVEDLPLTPSERVAKPALLARKENPRSDVYDAVADLWLT